MLSRWAASPLVSQPDHRTCQINQVPLPSSLLYIFLRATNCTWPFYLLPQEALQSFPSRTQCDHPSFYSELPKAADLPPWTFCRANQPTEHFRPSPSKLTQQLYIRFLNRFLDLLNYTRGLRFIPDSQFREDGQQTSRNPFQDTTNRPPKQNTLQAAVFFQWLLHLKRSQCM